MPEAFLDYSMNGRVRQPAGNRDDFMAPHDCYRCREEKSWVTIAVANQDEWERFRRALGDPARARDERFSTPALRRRRS
jgi:benzylsuccinate CoA-transferase BbsF subunit